MGTGPGERKKKTWLPSLYCIKPLGQGITETGLMCRSIRVICDLISATDRHLALPHVYPYSGNALSLRLYSTLIP